MKPFIAGNWKMHKTVGEAVEFARALAEALKDARDREVVIAPPFTALHSVSRNLAGSRLQLAAQNLHWEREGAYTGEISAAMAAEAGCRYAIIGHSERRKLFGEKDEEINRKLKSALAAGLGPIFCIGENIEDRDAGRTLAILGSQLRKGLDQLTGRDMMECVIAYEPVWAIGTGRAATPGQAQEAHAFIRKTIGKMFDESSAGIPVIYGGSVSPGNIRDLMEQPDINGVLVGGASLDIDSFVRIVNFDK
jgi:triosephosphate isomerase